MPLADPVDLVAPRPPPDPVPGRVVRQLAAIPRRRALESSDLWELWRDTVDAVCGALVHGRPPDPAPRPPRSFLRVATWNVQRGNRLPGILGTLRTHPALQDLDALMLNEVDLGMARSGNRDVAAEIGRELGFEWAFGNSYLCLDAGDQVDRRHGLAGENAHAMHGNAILSRWPIGQACNVPVHVTKDKFHSSEKRLGAKKALWARMDTPLGPVVLASAHLDSVASTHGRAAQLSDLLASLEPVRGLPTLLGGDLNTHTYDVQSPGGLLRNLGLKLVRGAFPHAIHHYMHPWELYETPVFRALEGAGFAWAPFNDLDRGTLRYEVGTFESESAVREHLPGVAVHVLRWRLKPWNGVAPLRMDWFAGRGLRALGEGEAADLDGRSSRAPTSAWRPRWEGAKVSDHDPLVVDVRPASGR